MIDYENAAKKREAKYLAQRLADLAVVPESLTARSATREVNEQLRQLKAPAAQV